MSAGPKSPTLAELPKLPESLAKSVKESHDLKHVETAEKQYIPRPMGRFYIYTLIVL